MEELDISAMVADSFTRERERGSAKIGISREEVACRLLQGILSNLPVGELYSGWPTRLAVQKADELIRVLGESDVKHNQDNIQGISQT